MFWVCLFSKILKTHKWASESPKLTNVGFGNNSFYKSFGLVLKLLYVNFYDCRTLCDEMTIFRILKKKKNKKTNCWKFWKADFFFFLNIVHFFFFGKKKLNFFCSNSKYCFVKETPTIIKVSDCILEGIVTKTNICWFVIILAT